MSPNSADRVAAIRGRLEGATPGPWLVAEREPDPATDGATFVSQIVAASDPSIPEGVIIEVLSGEWDDRPNAELIAHAPDDLTYLLAENARLRLALVNVMTLIDTDRMWRASGFAKDARDVLNGDPLMSDRDRVAIQGRLEDDA